MVGRAWSRKGCTSRPDRSCGNLSRWHLAFSKVFNIRPDRCTTYQWPILAPKSVQVALNCPKQRSITRDLRNGYINTTHDKVVAMVDSFY